MFTRLLSRWPAGGGALLLVLALSGVVAAAAVVAVVIAPTSERTHPTTATTLPYKDTNGNGVDDQCEQDVVANPAAAAAAEAAIDTDHDGNISVFEAAHSNRTGGKNCNHGGYVSSVARAQGDACRTTTTPGGAAGAITNTVDEANQAGDTECADEDAAEGTEDSDSTDSTHKKPTADCQAVAGPQPPAQLDTAPNAHGKWVSSVAQSGATGGKNCNHGGAVSEAAKLGKAERDAAKAARKAERQAAKDARKSNDH